MAEYTVRDKVSNKIVTFNWKLESPPTEKDLEDVFFQAGVREPSPTFLQKVGKEIKSLADPQAWSKSWENLGTMSQNPTEMLLTGISNLPLKIPESLKWLKGIAAARKAKEVEKLRPIPEIGKTLPLSAEEVVGGVTHPGMVARPITEVARETILPRKVVDPKELSPTSDLLEAARRATLKKVTAEETPSFLLKGEELLHQRAVNKKIEEWLVANPDDTLTKIAQSQLTRTGKLNPVTKTALMEKLEGVPTSQAIPTPQPVAPAQPVATPQPPLKPISPTLTQDEWRFLKGDFGTPLPKKGFPFHIKKLKEGLWGGEPPYSVFEREPTGKGMQFWVASEEGERAKNLFLKQKYTEFMNEVKFGPRTSQANLTGELLDRFETWDEILTANLPSEVRKHLTPEIQQAFTHIRENWSQLGDDLISKGLMEPTRKIRNYLFRMFDKDQIVQAWKDELSVLQNTKPGSKRISELEKAINQFETRGTLLYDVLPHSLNVPFLNPRTGRAGYSIDAVSAYHTWLQYYGKKVFTEPVLKKGLEVMKGLSPEYKEYTTRYLKRYANLEKEWKLASWERALTSLFYIKSLGWNTRSALVNGSQILNQVIELGPKGMVYIPKAIHFGNTPAGKALWEASGHATEVPELRWGIMADPIERSLKSAFYLFDKMEKGLRKTAYLSGYLKGIDKKLPVELAKKLGDEVNRRCNFLYGKVGAPLLMTEPGGRVGFQFSTFAINQLELLNYWWKTDKRKFASYLVIASAAQEGLKELGIDMSNALGIGVDFGELTKAVSSLGKGEVRAAWAHGRTAFGTGGGLFPSGLFPAVTSLINLIKGEVEKEIPPAFERAWTAGRALVEGPVKTPTSEGYPIRAPLSKDLRHTETLGQLFLRTFIAKPRVESEATIKLLLDRHFEESRKSRMGKIVNLWLDGEREEAQKLISLYGRPSSDMFEAERDRRRKTSFERRSPKKGGRLEKFKKRLGEGGEPEMVELAPPPVREQRLEELEVR